MSTTITKSESIKVPEVNFRSAADIENFYRFIHENDLRREAAQIFDTIITRLDLKKRRRRRKTQ